MGSAGLLPRHVHPGAWWLWALGLATAASRTTNPLLLALIVAVAGYVVVARREATPWAGTYGAFLRLGLVIIAVRVLMTALFGVTQGTTVLFTLPEVPLPDWASGVRLGGPVTAEGMLAALYDGMRLATVIICVGAANALVPPTRLLRCVPAALYEAGVAVVVAMTVAPQLIRSAGRVREARRLRGHTSRGLRAVRGVAVPVLEGALERSLELAAAMDSRGYGRRAEVPIAVQRVTATLTLGGLLGVCAGVYGLLDAGSPPLLGLPLLAGGLVAAGCGMYVAGRRVRRSRYRPDPWALPEWLTAAAGAVAGGLTVATALVDPVALMAPVSPLAWPTLPLLPAAGVLLALLPAWVTPPPPPPDVARPPARTPAPSRAEAA
ncbi:MAG: CbiQ family ECF transporter T component [Actinomycetes bacterium]